jgi:hypothetical protein
VDTGSREENASKRESSRAIAQDRTFRAPFLRLVRFGIDRLGSALIQFLAQVASDRLRKLLEIGESSDEF